MYPLCRLCNTDVVLDAGCSGGTAVLILTCLSNCTGIGIDIDDNRVALANLHSKSVMESTRIDKDLKVCFADGDVTHFKTLNGITVLYLYDCAFDKRQHGLVVAAINASYSLRCFTSSLDLRFFRSEGLDEVWDNTGDIHVSQIGGNCERKLYIYSKPNETDTNGSIIVETFMAEMLKRAVNRELRKQYVDSAHNVWLKSKDFIRSSKIPPDTDHCIRQSFKLFTMLQNKTYYNNANVARFYGQGTLTLDPTHDRSKYR